MLLVSSVVKAEISPLFKCNYSHFFYPQQTNRHAPIKFKWSVDLSPGYFSPTSRPDRGEQFVFKKLRVVNSFDPNNIICAQGDEVTSNEEINKIFYTINFENLGNAAAKNIRIENPIDTNWLDVNSFEVVNYSHPALVSITGDLATYHFENIELPATGANKGYITYAIRPKKNWSKVIPYPIKPISTLILTFPLPPTDIPLHW